MLSDLCLGAFSSDSGSFDIMHACPLTFESSFLAPLVPFSSIPCIFEYWHGRVEILFSELSLEVNNISLFASQGTLVNTALDTASGKTENRVNMFLPMSTHNICFHEEQKYLYFLTVKSTLSGAMFMIIVAII